MIHQQSTALAVLPRPLRLSVPYQGKLYCGERLDAGLNPVYVGGFKGAELDPCWKLTGGHPFRSFDWGNRNMGAAQLAVAILFDYLGSAELAKHLKWSFVDTFLESKRADRWTIIGDSIADWVERQLEVRLEWAPPC